MAKPDRGDVAHVVVGLRLTGWERVGLDLLAERARLRERLHAAGIAEKYVEPMTAPTFVRSLLQREIAAAALKVDDLKREVTTSYPRKTSTTQEVRRSWKQRGSF